MFKQYKVIEGKSGKALSEALNTYLENDFVPITFIGGVQVVTVSQMNERTGCMESDTTFYQAVALNRVI